MKTIIASIVLAACLCATPVRSPSLRDEQVFSVDIPIGIWPLCAAGIEMPGCYPGMPETWEEIVYTVNPDGSIDRIISETIL